jgi:hypothetical protein
MADQATQKATVLQILDWYESPELILLEGPPLNYVLAVRSADLSSPANTYVGGAMSSRRLRDYANGKCDLRFALAHANFRRFWTFAYTPGDQFVEMTQIKRSNPELQSSIPQAGLFARDHEEIDLVKTFVPNTVETLLIDGSWDLGEFSQLYGQIEDIYYISFDMDRYDDPQISIQEKYIIKQSFDRSWDGGGSYVAFYRDVANDNDYHAPLRVSGIQYNSPGHVKIHARSEPFKNVLHILQYYSDNETKVRKAYNALGAFMSANKLKRKGASNTLMTDSVRNSLESKCQDLSVHLPGISYDTLKEMTGGNSLVAAKVIASIFRRVERLFRFFDEGRVSHSKLTLDGTDMQP